jgi:hypothetical protein
MLDIALDQVSFISNLLDLQGLLTRVTGYCRLREAQKSLPERSFAVMKAALAAGEISRGEVPGLIDKSPRTAQSVIAQLLQEGLLTSPSPKGPLQVGFPPHAAAAFFPDLFPSGDVPVPQEASENDRTGTIWKVDWHSIENKGPQRSAGGLGGD